MKLLAICILFLLFLPRLILAQECIGGQVLTHEAYLYGRFEVAMRSVGEEGVVSSFFLYNIDLDCNWPAENNEIDIEMTGNSQDVLFTTHYPGPWYYTNNFTPNFNPHAGIHEYAFEWEPGIVRWFVDGQLAVVQDQSFVGNLIHPMRIMMNLWASEIVNWVGTWDPAVMPVYSEYDYVRYSSYTPGTGTTGTNNNFTPQWTDHFDAIDSSRWEVSQFESFDRNYCTFMETSVEVDNGHLRLQLEPEPTNPDLTPVTFSVNLRDENLEPSDVIFLNSTFNNWCGTCQPMTENNGVWSVTIDLPPGRHEYLFAKNLWEEKGGAPLGSECDILPCDEWNNYGVVVNAGDDPVVLETVCWKSCTECDPPVGILTVPINPDRKLMGVYDLLGREVAPDRIGQPLIYRYDDGSVEKRVIWNH